MTIKKMNEFKKESTKAPWWQPSLLLFSKLSGWIIGPVILGIILGKWLDKKFQTDPWLFIITVGVAFLISMFGIVKDAITAMKEIEKQETGNKDQETIKKK